MGASLTNLANAYYALGEFRKAIDMHLEHLAIAREIGDRHRQAIAHGDMGLAHFALGEFHEADENHRQHLSIAGELGNRRGQANALTNLGNVHYSLGEARKAVELHGGRLSFTGKSGTARGKRASSMTWDWPTWHCPTPRRRSVVTGSLWLSPSSSACAGWRRWPSAT